MTTIVNGCKHPPPWRLLQFCAILLSCPHHFVSSSGQWYKTSRSCYYNTLLAIMRNRYAGTWSDKIKEQEDKKRKMIAASNQAQPSPNIFGDFSFLRRPNEWKKSAWVIATLWVLLIGTAIYLQTWRIPVSLEQAIRISAGHLSMVWQNWEVLLIRPCLRML